MSAAMNCGQFSTFYARSHSVDTPRKLQCDVLPDPPRGFVAMRAEDHRHRSIEKIVGALIGRPTIGRHGSPIRGESFRRRKPAPRRAPWWAGSGELTALAQAWSVTTISVVALSAAVALAPMWDRAIFVKSLLEALNTNPEMLQLSGAVTDSAPADQASNVQTSVNHSEREGN
jgi:hypothetical protein